MAEKGGAVHPQYPSGIDNLPITPFLDEAASLLAGPERALVLTAETGAGKSTAMPLALLQHFPGKILMLEPRRIAALAVASRVATLLGEEVGETSGYRMHLETCVSAKTRFEVLTEAILVRMLQSDPSLEGVSVVVLDEFHERSVHSDLALAFLKDAAALRDDLYILVMSATMDAERVASYLSCRTFSVPGRLFPVDVQYRPYADGVSSSTDVRTGGGMNFSGRDDIAGKAARVVLDVLPDADGDILVFLPGLSELNRARDFILDALPEIDVRILHSSTPFAEQKRILAGHADEADARGTLTEAGGLTKAAGSHKQIRRVILASSIAETSITVPGVTVVIDCGLSRESRYSPAAGMNRLITLTESEFSAGQRAGRAGRVAPGTCIRLWSEADSRIKDAPPEIMHTDLMPVVLECALWGVRDIGALDWLDVPPESAWNTCSDLLKTLGCLEADGAITQKGRDALSLGVHPRIACVALQDNTCYPYASKEVLPELDTHEAADEQSCRSDNTRAGLASKQPDALDYACKYGAQVSRGMNAAAVRREEERLRSALEKRIAACGARASKRTSHQSADTCLKSGPSSKQTILQTSDATCIQGAGALCLLAGFPDRLAHHAGGGVYQFPSGRKASLPHEYLAKTNDAALPEWIIAPDADAGEREGRIYRWEAVSDKTSAAFKKAGAQALKADGALSTNKALAAEKTGGASKTDSALAAWLAAHQNVRVETEFVGAAGTQKLKKTEYTCYGEIILKERRLEATADDNAAAWETLVRRNGVRALPWNETCDAFLLRWEFRMRHVRGAFTAETALTAHNALTAQSASTADSVLTAGTASTAHNAVTATPANPADERLHYLAAHPEGWLTPFIPRDGRLSAQTVLEALRYALDGDSVDRDVPLKLKLENGRERRLTYEVLDKAAGPTPVLEVIIQQMFGCTKTPAVMGEPVLLRLLSPARRPLQVTRDLAGFWQNTWPEVCKEMKGRYPKHNWDHTLFVDD